jgi:Flp pilus assembly protein TadD
MAVSLGSFAVGLLSKEQALVLPALVVIYDLGASRGAAIRRFFRFFIPRYAPYLVVFLLYMAARIAVLGVSVPAGEGIPFINNPLAYVSLPERLMTAATIAGKYLWLCVWPAQLSVDYSFNSIPMVSSALDLGFLVSVLAWFLLIALLAWSYIKRVRLVLIATFLMILTFFPASNLLVVIGTIMGERLFYLPSVGLALLAAGGWDGLRAHASTSGWVYHSISAGLVAAMLLLTARTVVRNRDWQSNETLLRSAALVVPGNAKIQHNLAVLEKDPEKALMHMEKTHEIYPDYVKRNSRVAYQHGLVLLKADRLDEGVKMMESAARRRPKIPDLQFNLGFAYMKQGRWAAAEEAYRKAMALNLNDIRIHNNLSFVLWKQGRHAEALEAADVAAELNRNYSEAHYNRGAALEAMGKLKEAAVAYEEAFKLKPTSSVRQRLDKVREQLGMNGGSRGRK